MASSDQFRLAYRQGQRVANALLVLYLRPNGLARCRVGIAVPGRFGTAVARNRMKRRLREAVRLTRDRPDGADMVMVPKDAAKEAPVIALSGAVQQLIRRAAGAPGDVTRR